MRILPLTLCLVILSLTIGLYAEPVPLADSVAHGDLLVQSAAQPPAQWNFTIYVGTTGFNSTYKAGLTLSVNQGDLVTIWFIYNDTGANNPHDIGIQAYGLSTGTIDQSTPVKSLSFTANIPGLASIVCTDVNCEGHANLQAAVLDVKSSTGAEWIETTLHLSVKVQAHSKPVVSLTAHMIDINGSVVSGVLLRFYRNSTWGFAQIGVGVTNSSGLTAIAYTPPAEGNVVFQTVFAGAGPYLPSSSGAIAIYYAFPGGSQPGFPYVSGQNPTLDLRFVGVPGWTGLFWIGVAFLVVSFVWANYLFVLRQVVGIWKDGTEESRKTSSSQAQTVGLGRYPVKVPVLSYPITLLIGLGLVAMGYANFLMLTLLAGETALVLLPALSLVEAVVLHKLLRRLHKII